MKNLDLYVQATLEAIVVHHSLAGSQARGDPRVVLWSSPKEPGSSVLTPPREGIGLTQEGRDLFEQLTRRVINEKPGVGRYFSREYVETLVLVALHDLLHAGVRRNLGVALQGLWSSLDKKPKRYLIITPLQDLIVRHPFRVGEVGIYPSTAEGAIRMRQDASAQSRLELERLWFEKAVEKGSQDGVATAVVSAAEIGRAMEIGTSDVDLVLDVFRLVFPKSTMGMLGSHAAGESEVGALGLDEEEFRESYVELGSRSPYPLTRDVADYVLTSEAYARLLGMLFKASRTDLEDRIIRSLRWFGKAVKQPGFGDKVLEAYIGLESLLLSGDRAEGGKAATIAERSAFLLGTDLDTRKGVYLRAQKASAARNRVTHRGELGTDATEAEDTVGLLRDLILRTAELSNRVSTFENLRDLLDRAKFS